ncbi:MAG: hypothetical protein PHD74_06625 [Candidatus Krumholzibacteria bacterium]|nr:hypothetical protein [Candidatus Krumholzibacteria bacterium]
MKAKLVAIACLAAAWAAALQGLLAARSAGGSGEWSRRWVYVSSNLYVDENIPKLESLLRRARAAGYNGILFSDSKTLTWWRLEAPDRWQANAARLRALASELGMELVVCVFPFGYAESFLAHDPNLAAGLPVRNAPLVRRGDYLVAEQTATIENGSFEEHSGNRAAGFGVQDDPGKGSFMDERVSRDGRSSLRFENVGAANEHGNARVFQRVSVRPWQQYRIRAWMKTEHLTADMVQIVALALRKPLQYQNLVVPAEEGFRYFSAAADLTTDWVEQSVTFNSLGNTSVIIGAGAWGAKGGTIWWDDLRIDAVPALNVLRRETLPLTVVGKRGMKYEEGRDFAQIADPGLGRYRWPGTYDTRHDPPPIAVPRGSRIREGERVRLSCYNPAIIYGGQVSCTLDDPEVFKLCREQIIRTRAALAPDGYMLTQDEIRCAGWEPSQEKNFRGSGELFAFNVRRCLEIARGEGGGKPVYVWSDMYDPYHNARADYYLVKGSVSKSWEGLDPGVTVVEWGEQAKAAKSLEFFSGRAHRLMIAAFYDGDVKRDHDLWMKAIVAAPRIEGVIYTTWENDYSKLEEFAGAWWGGGR